MTDHLVELLRQRVARADELLNTVSASTGNIMDALDTALDALARATGKAYSADDPAVQAVARALLGEDRPTDLDYEWCVFLGSDDPNGDVARITTDTQEHAEADLALLLQTRATAHLGVAYRTVNRTPWQVVDTEGGEPDGSADDRR